MRRLAGAGALPLILASCGGEGGGGGSTEPVAVVTAPAPTPSPSATPTPAATTSVTTAAYARYDIQPDVPTCRAGRLTAAVKADVLAKLNAIRALHRLPAVTYSDVDDEQVAESSLMMVANGQLSHTPPTGWRCYTAVGAAGAGSGNLFSSTVSGNHPGYTDDQYLGGWLTENGAANLGHRRWMLDPFLGKAAYGRASQITGNSVSDAATLKVFGFTGGVPTPANLPPFVAYPYGDYPSRYFTADAYLSFSVVASATRGGNGGVGFANAAVSVTAGSASLAVTDMAWDNQGYGLPNNLQWRVTGLQPGITYTVRVSGIRGAAQTEYSYTFRVVA